MASNVGNISWQKTATTVWTANTQVRSGTSYAATVTLSAGTYTLSVNAGAYTYAAKTLKRAKGEFARYLRDK